MTEHGSSNRLLEGGKVFDRLALVVFVLAALLRIAYAYEAANTMPVLRQPLADSIVYVESAKTIASGQLVADTPFYRAPLYSYLIAPFYLFDDAPETAIIGFQVLLGLMILFITWRIARNLYGAAPALLSLILVGLLGSLAAAETKLLGTTLGIFLGTLALWILTTAKSGRGFLLAGLCLGAAALTRPNVVLVVIGVVVLLLFTRQSLQEGFKRRAFPMLLGFALLVAPATLHNLLAGDFVLISWNGGMTFYHGNNAANRSGLLEPGPLTPGGINAVQQSRKDISIASELAGRQLRPSESSSFWFRQGIKDVVSDPAAALRRVGVKLYRFAGAHEYADNYSHAVEENQVGRLRMFLIPFPLLLIPAVVALILKPPRRREDQFVLIFAGLGLITCLLFYVGSRYRSESVPALAILAGVILTAAPAASRTKKLLASGAVIVLIALALIPAGRRADSQDAMAATYWAGALARDGRPDEARAMYRDATRFDYKNPVPWARWAAYATETSGIEDGVRILDKAIARGADGAIIRAERGTLLIQLGKVEKAERDLSLALSARPDDPTVRLNLAACLIKRGADDEAGPLLNHPELDIDPVALYYRGLLKIRAEQWREAMADFDAAIEAGARDPRLFVLRVMAWIRLGEVERAAGWLRDWLQTEGCAPNDVRIEETVAMLSTAPSILWLDYELMSDPACKSVNSVLTRVHRAWHPEPASLTPGQ